MTTMSLAGCGRMYFESESVVTWDESGDASLSGQADSLQSGQSDSLWNGQGDAAVSGQSDATVSGQPDGSLSGQPDASLSGQPDGSPDAQVGPSDASLSCVPAEVCSACQVQCNACPISADPREQLLGQREGFGRQAGTGSLSWAEVVVTNLGRSGPGSLESALSAGQRWVTFDPSLSGTISLNATLNVPSDIVIDGRGADVTLSAPSSVDIMTLQSVRNVVVTHLQFEGGNSSIFVRDGSRDIWLDHLTLSNARNNIFTVSGAGNSSADRPDLITVSWTRVHQSAAVMLLSSTETNIYNSPDRVTLHHNYWSENLERHPLVRFSRVHAHNNWLYHWGAPGTGQGVRVGQDGQYYSEANIYDDAYSRPGLVPENLGTYGYTRSVNDLVTGNPDMQERGPAQVFVPGDHYSYVTDTADQALRDCLTQQAGWQAVN